MQRSLCSQRHHRDQKSNFAFHDALPVHVEGAWVSQLSSRSVQFSRRFICCGRGGFRHFPSAFNSSPVLPPCLRRRVAVISPANSKGLACDGFLGFNCITFLPPTKTKLAGSARSASPELLAIACAIDEKPSPIQE